MTSNPSAPESTRQRAKILGLHFDSFDVERLVTFARDRPSDQPFAYITTPNVDHVVRLWTENYPDEIRTAYREADVTVCDSKVLALLARWRGVHLTMASGSDVIARLLEAEQGSTDPMVLIGGDESAVAVLKARFGLSDLIQHIPPMGLLHNDAALSEAARFIRDHPARYVFIAVGSPQQEIIALRAKQFGSITGIGLCIGASIDYLTGKAHRAPRLLRMLALEWLYRLIREPRRLWRRYLVRSPKIFLLIGRDRGNDR